MEFPRNLGWCKDPGVTGASRGCHRRTPGVTGASRGCHRRTPGETHPGVCLPHSRCDRGVPGVSPRGASPPAPTTRRHRNARGDIGTSRDTGASRSDTREGSLARPGPRVWGGGKGCPPPSRPPGRPGPGASQCKTDRTPHRPAAATAQPPAVSPKPSTELTHARSSGRAGGEPGPAPTDVKWRRETRAARPVPARGRRGVGAAPAARHSREKTPLRGCWPQISREDAPPAYRSRVLQVWAGLWARPRGCVVYQQL